MAIRGTGVAVGDGCGTVFVSTAAVCAPRHVILASGTLRALDLAGGAVAKSLHDEFVVVLFLALLVGPVVGSDPGLDDELVAFACVMHEQLGQGAERHEPESCDDLARRALFVFPGVVVADETEACVSDIALRNRHMKEKYLETKKFPEAKLEIKSMPLPRSLVQPTEGQTFGKVNCLPLSLA